MNLRERIEKSITKEVSGCWSWNKSRNARGYGQIAIKKVCKLAHRISYEVYVGPIPDGHGVLHRCDNPPCVNPSHLFTGDQKVNLQDMSKKKRWKNQFMDRTHCVKGHPLVGENLKSSPSIPKGRKICRTCNLAWRKNNRRKNENE